MMCNGGAQNSDPAVNGADAGKRYFAVYSQINNGLAFSLCTLDWGSKMDALGLEAFVSRVQYPLSRGADAGSVRVKVNGQWEYA